MIEEDRDEFLQRAGEAFASEPIWRDQIRASAYAIKDYLSEDRRRAQFVFVEVLTAGERARLIRDQGMELLFDLIDLGRTELDDPESMSRATAVAIGGTIYDQLQLAVARDTISEKLVRDLLYAVVLPYLGPEAAEEELRRPRPSKRGNPDRSAAQATLPMTERKEAGRRGLGEPR